MLKPCHFTIKEDDRYRFGKLILRTHTHRANGGMSTGDEEEAVIAGPFSLFEGSLILEFLQPKPSRNASGVCSLLLTSRVLARAKLPRERTGTLGGFMVTKSRGSSPSPRSPRKAVGPLAAFGRLGDWMDRVFGHQTTVTRE